MSHQRDHDHHASEPPPRDEPPHESKPCPDRKRREHPTLVPGEPVDSSRHPTRRLIAQAPSRTI